MTPFASDREILLAYRLDEIPSADRDAMDERILSDHELSDRMQEAEYDLLDDYHAGRLNLALRRRVERAFSREELRRPSPSSSRAQNFAPPAGFSSGNRLRFALRVSLAVAVLLLFAIAGWMISSRFASWTKQSPAAQTPPSKSPAPSISSAPKGQVEQAAQQVAILLLSPAITRGNATCQLMLQPADSAILVQWVVPSNLSARAFSLRVLRNGIAVATLPSVDLRKIEDSNVAEFKLPRKMLPSPASGARYVFIIQAAGANSTVEAEYPVLISEAN